MQSLKALESSNRTALEKSRRITQLTSETLKQAHDITKLPSISQPAIWVDNRMQNVGN